MFWQWHCLRFYCLQYLVWELHFIMLIADSRLLLRGQSCECRCVETGRDSVDFAIVKECKAEDIVVTQDVGLAAMVLPKVKAVLNTYGWFYTNRNIDKLLNSRHLSSVQRQRRNFHKRPKKRVADNTQNLGRQLAKAVST